jgi:hypothetical protein
MSDLDDVFNDEPVPEPTPAPEPEPSAKVEHEPSPEPPAEAQEQNKEPASVETTATNETESKEDWTYSAYKDEKGKRQEFAKENERLKAQLAELQRGGETESQAIPDPVDDPEGFTNAVTARAESIAEGRILQMSENLLRKTYDDYDAKKEVFVKLVKDNPQLRIDAQNSGDPLGYLYDQATKYQQYQEMQDIEGYKAKLKAEVMAEIKAEQGETQRAQADKTSNITPSLATAPAANSIDSVPSTDLNDILSGRGY